MEKGKGHFLPSLTQTLDTQRHLSTGVLLWVPELEVREDFTAAFPGHLLCFMLDLLTSSSSLRSLQRSGRETLTHTVQKEKLRLGEIKQFPQVTEANRRQKPCPKPQGSQDSSWEMCHSCLG